MSNQEEVLNDLARVAYATAKGADAAESAESVNNRIKDALREELAKDRNHQE